MPDDSEDTRVRINALRKAYGEQLPAKLKEIEDTWTRLAGGAWNSGDFLAFHRAVHALAGSGAMFGFPELSTRARSLDLLLKPMGEGRETPDPEMVRRIADGWTAIKEAAAR
ncbi:MAG TPA: Hpt domain-containing protein [Planctomycetota bacterium]|nr:Hpt domain-containing protein [Planctomycetota bacterium]